MPHIEVDDHTYQRLELLAAAWHTTIADVVDRLVTAALAIGATPRRARAATPPVAVHAVYAGTRVEAIFEPESHHLTLRTGPLRGQTYLSPNDAHRAVITLLDPGAAPVGNGWTFWTVTATGAGLHTLHQ
jgi:hypothetical protein